MRLIVYAYIQNDYGTYSYMYMKIMVQTYRLEFIAFFSYIEFDSNLSTRIYKAVCSYKEYSSKLSVMVYKAIFGYQEYGSTYWSLFIRQSAIERLLFKLIGDVL